MVTSVGLKGFLGKPTTAKRESKSLGWKSNLIMVILPFFSVESLQQAGCVQTGDTQRHIPYPFQTDTRTISTSTINPPLLLFLPPPPLPRVLFFFPLRASPNSRCIPIPHPPHTCAYTQRHTPSTHKHGLSCGKTSD